MELIQENPPVLCIKDRWIEEIEQLCKDQLTPKAIASIIGVHKTRVYRDLESGKFKNASKKGPGSRASWDFSHKAAIAYIETFEDTKPITTIPSKKLPGIDWDSFSTS